ncbi:MAG: hypothetical protein R3D68_00265 [Hyphomicrobiaceae bacterium]
MNLPLNGTTCAIVGGIAELAMRDQGRSLASTQVLRARRALGAGTFAFDKIMQNQRTKVIFQRHSEIGFEPESGARSLGYSVDGLVEKKYPRCHHEVA